MSKSDYPFVKHVAVGVCGLSCYLCPNYNTDAKSRCEGCKSEGRMGAACAFLTCAVKKKGIEFCWNCEDCGSCEKWKKHREAGKRFDSFKCYQKLEDDILFIQDHGVERFVEAQEQRHELLKEMFGLQRRALQELLLHCSHNPRPRRAKGRHRPRQNGAGWVGCERPGQSASRGARRDSSGQRILPETPPITVLVSGPWSRSATECSSRYMAARRPSGVVCFITRSPTPGNTSSSP